MTSPGEIPGFEKIWAQEKVRLCLTAQLVWDQNLLILFFIIFIALVDFLLF
jgi:hypothetical protein